MPREISFSPFQRRLIVGAISGIAAFIVIGIFVVAFWLLTKFVALFSTVIWPIVVAMIFALLLQPIYDSIYGYFKRKIPSSSFPKIFPLIFTFLLVLLFAGSITLLLMFIIPILSEQCMEVVQHIPVVWNGFLESHPNLANWIAAQFEGEGIVGQLKENANFGTQLRDFLLASFPKLKFAFEKVELLFSQTVAIAVIPIYFYYLISGQHDLIGKVKTETKAFFSDKVADDLGFLMEQFRGILVSFFRGQIIVVLCYSIFLALGFKLCGLQGGILFGLFLGMLNIIPYLGTIFGLCIVLPIAFFSGGIWLLVGVLTVFCLAQLLESYVLTPRIMEKQTGLHPMVIMVSIFFWAIAFDSILGMLLAIPLTAFIVVFWRLFKERYLPQLKKN